MAHHLYLQAKKLAAADERSYYDKSSEYSYAICSVKVN